MGSTYRGPVCGGPMKRAPLQEPYEEGPWAFTEGTYWKDILEGPLFVHSCTSKGLLCEKLFMESTCRGPICGAL